MLDTRFEELLRGYLPYLGAGEPLTEDTALRDFGLDSMGTVELLSAVEAEYDTRLDDEALTLETFATPGTLWKALARA